MTLMNGEMDDQLGYIKSEHRIALVDIQNGLIRFGLTPNQSKIFIHLSKTGTKTAPQISKNLSIQRTETYNLLKTLQQKGVVHASFDYPIKYAAMPFNESLSLLIKSEKDKIIELENHKNDLVKLWETLPSVGNPGQAIRDNKFQVLQGNAPILNKFKAMTESANEKIIMLGSNDDYLKLHHTEFMEYMKKTKVEIKILTTGSNKTDYVFGKIPQEKIRRFSPGDKEDLCFIIRDDKELIFFIKNQSKTELTAVWTDSQTLINSLSVLFTLIWSRTNLLKSMENSISEKTEKNYAHDVREIEQERMILDYLHRCFPDMTKSN